MRVILLPLIFFAVVKAAEDATVPSEFSSYDYHNRYGIPEADRIWKLENEITKTGQRVVGGSTTTILSVPYQAGLILTINVIRTSVCGGVIIADNRILTAAHCRNDGNNIVTSITVVLGSNLLFSGGTRITTNDVLMHPGYNPWIVANDIAVIRISRVTFTTLIQPVNLPSGSEVNMNFVGNTGLLSGYGITRDGDSVGLLQTLTSVNVPVISNADCTRQLGNFIQNHHLCTSGANRRGACAGDTGGPLVVTINRRRVLIGVSSFFSTRGCQASLPSGFSRVTSFLSWIRSI
ncbi:brachyurin [Manduca sexta]|uniref:Elastase n=1 Tax=Manduca sexta TaxID=7130 RepID=Q25510_MANSE|nr:brachyurin [Manduca sexta]AAA67842.1 elastase [Manduca sexta]